MNFETKSNPEPKSKNFLSFLLKSSGYSKEFSEFIGETYEKFSPHSVDNAKIMLISEPNMGRLVIEDFTRNCKNLKSLVYTNIDEEALRDHEVGVEMSELTNTIIGPGVHKHNNGIYLVYESLRSLAISADSSSKSSYHIALMTFGDNHNQIDKYIDDLKDLNNDKSCIKCYTCNGRLEWIEQQIPKRSPKSLFIGNVWKDIYEDAKKFFTDETKQFFDKHGATWKRSYLFHSDPGCGKSSTIRTLASELGVNMYSLNLASARLTDEDLMEAIRNVENKSIVTVEDIDRIFDNHTVNTTDSHVSFSQFLNIIDGSLSRSGILFIFTCNNMDQMDDALIRAGRISRIFKFPNASQKSLKNMFLSFYPEHKKESKEFVSKVGDTSNITMAAAENFFLQHRDDSPKQILEKINCSVLKKRKRSAHHDYMM